MAERPTDAVSDQKECDRPKRPVWLLAQSFRCGHQIVEIEKQERLSILVQFLVHSHGRNGHYPAKAKWPKNAVNSAILFYLPVLNLLQRMQRLTAHLATSPRKRMIALLEVQA